MLNIPPDLLGRFVTVLEERGVPLAQHSYYKKWLRYYVDFCDKYRLEATSSKSQAQFLDKLREKKQTDWQIKQAAHAVSLYWDVQRALKPSAATSGPEPLSRAAEASIPYGLPASIPKGQAAGPEKRSQIRPVVRRHGIGHSPSSSPSSKPCITRPRPSNLTATGRGGYMISGKPGNLRR